MGFDTVLLKAIVRHRLRAWEAMLRGSNIKDTGVGDPVVKVMLGIQRYDIGWP